MILGLAYTALGTFSFRGEPIELCPGAVPAIVQKVDLGRKYEKNVVSEGSETRKKETCGGKEEDEQEMK
jgi:hypothetical protein